MNAVHPDFPHSAGSPAGGRGLLVGAALAACIAPFWCVTFPPSTDLPQHLSQIVLLKETLAGLHPDFVVTPWYYPNTLIYLLIGFFWQFADPLNAGRLTLSALAAAWVLATFALAASRARPIAHWLIGVPLAFNFLFSWGLLNFLCGWPLFCLFIIAESAAGSRRRTILLMLAGLLLYYAHALWFLAANVWLVVQMLERDRGTKLRSALALLPPWALALAWYPQLAANRTASGVATSVQWETMPLERLDPKYLIDAALGAIHGPLEAAFLSFLVLWLGAIVATNRKTMAAQIDKPIFAAALVLGLAFWVLPSAYMNTIFFNSRWLPCCAALLLLSLPAPCLDRKVLLGSGLLFLGLFSAATVRAWMNWEREEFAGLAAAIELIHPSDRVLGMDIFGGSIYVKGRPGLQAFAWAQAIRGCKVHFSFTEHYSGAVQFRSPPPPNPKRKLVSVPVRATLDDLRGFDLVLIDADQRIQDFMRERLHLVAVGNHSAIDPGDGAWRLYRVAGE